MTVGLGQLLIILILVLVLFGAGNLPKVMADLGKGLRLFKENLNVKEEQLDQSKERNKIASEEIKLESFSKNENLKSNSEDN